jgi:hypothetical protein
VSKLCWRKTTVLETDGGIYTSHQSAKKSPENIKDGVLHIRKFEGKRLASAAFQYDTLI